MKKYIRSFFIFLLLASLHFACLDTDLKTVIFTGIADKESITEISAEIEGIIITANGSISEHGHCWGEDTTANPTIENNRTQLGAKGERGNFISSMFGLAPNTGYAIRGYAVVNGEVVYGNRSTFKTAGENKDFIVTSYTTNITQNSAFSIGKINRFPNNNPASQHGHCWVLADAFNQIQPVINNPAHNKTELGERKNSGEFTSELKSLFINRIYRVRAYMIVGGQVIYGNTLNFTTTQN